MSNWLISPTEKKAGETINVVVSFKDKLDPDETLSGTPTAVELRTEDLTISEVIVTALEHTISGIKIPASLAVTFVVAGGTAREDYTIRVTADTSLEQVLVRDMRLKVT